MNNTQSPQPPQNPYSGYPPPQGPPPTGPQQGGYPPPYGGYPPYYPPQPPKKSTNVPAIIAGVIALIAVAALVVVFAVPSVRASIFPPAATATALPTYTPLPTYTKQPTVAPTATRAMPTAAPTAISQVSDYSGISLGNGILPQGFEILTEDEAEAMGLDVSSFSSSISAFTDAPVQSVMVAMNSDTDAFQVIVALVAAPMSTAEQSNFDREISDPDTAAEQFAIGMGSGASAWVMDGGDMIGDSSLGMQLYMSTSGVSMGGEVVLARRSEALQMVIYLYLEGARQQVTAINLADAIDYQIQQVQK